jgi:DNA-binding GntR family transcriptional regulator
LSHLDIDLRIEPPVPIREKVYKHLRDQILGGRIPLTATLIEARLAKQIGISRTPIREALHFLEKEGLLEAIPRVGYRVTPVQWEEVEEISEIRKVVEALAVRWVIKRITPTELDAINANIALSRERVRKGNMESFVDLDAEFHELIAQASGSRRILELICRLRIDMLRYRMKSLHRQDTASLALDGHQRILKAIVERDEAGAEAAVRDHLDQARKYIRLYAFETKDQVTPSPA